MNLDLVVLAAGEGKRMKEKLKNKPKISMPILSNVSLLDCHAMFAMEAKKEGVPIQGIFVVTGYRSEFVEQKIKLLSKHLQILFTVIYNPFFALSNNLVSLYLALLVCKNDFVIINGDDVLLPKAFIKLLDTTELVNGLLLAISRKDRYDEDDMKVKEEKGYLKFVGKRLARGIEANAESVGFCVVRGMATSLFRNIVSELVRRKEFLNSFWLTAVQLFAQRFNNLAFVREVPYTAWHEFDVPADLEDFQNNPIYNDLRNYVAEIKRTLR